jgi:hypothetical protein
MHMDILEPRTKYPSVVAKGINTAGDGLERSWVMCLLSKIMGLGPIATLLSKRIAW